MAKKLIRIRTSATVITTLEVDDTHIQSVEDALFGTSDDDLDFDFIKKDSPVVVSKYDGNPDLVVGVVTEVDIDINYQNILGD